MRRSRRKLTSKRESVRPVANAVNECWAMDFVSDALFNGRRIRALTLLDVFSRENLAIAVAKSLKGEEVVKTLGSVHPSWSANKHTLRQRNRVHIQGGRSMGL